ncbi:MAG: [FeFe] hydrogenase H-cluster maturation GTPase HydF [Clostridia bacterium]|nr:[FeFe] hydrogenase H-cluster maturation GTPase HydF [Clostridia bacterium]
MEKTPISLRTHVSIFGNTNAGKSALFNAIAGQDMMIVSEKKGTTTDPVVKAMELLPYGPIALTDTAGLGDDSEIGAARMAKTAKILNRTDFAIYAADVTNFDEQAYEKAKADFEKKKIDHLLVFTKSDLGYGNIKEKYPDAVFTSVKDEKSIESLKNIIVKKLSNLKPEKETMIGDLLPAGSTVVMVVPIDSEAPKGRIILPQVQFLRDCLDYGMKCVVVRELELEEALKELRHIDLVVTDSQAFAMVSKIVPDNIMLTSFSMMMAKLKGDINPLVDGAKAIDLLKDGSKILMAEACTHNHTHEDIGRVKIPALLQKRTGKHLEFEYSVFHDFPEDVTKYDLVVHCGACMINSRAMKNRVELCKEYGVPITNYGVLLAYVNNILDRCTRIFQCEKNQCFNKSESFT